MQVQVTLKQIRADLKDIRYYYSLQDVFEKGKKVIYPKAVLDKVERYANAMKNASAKLYALYVSLYVNGIKQVEFAHDMRFDIVYVKELNRELCLFLQSQFSKGGEALED